MVLFLNESGHGFFVSILLIQGKFGVLIAGQLLGLPYSVPLNPNLISGSWGWARGVRMMISLKQEHCNHKEKKTTTIFCIIYGISSRKTQGAVTSNPGVFSKPHVTLWNSNKRWMHSSQNLKEIKTQRSGIERFFVRGPGTEGLRTRGICCCCFAY